MRAYPPMIRPWFGEEKFLSRSSKDVVEKAIMFSLLPKAIMFCLLLAGSDSSFTTLKNKTEIF